MIVPLLIVIALLFVGALVILLNMDIRLRGIAILLHRINERDSVRTREEIND